MFLNGGHQAQPSQGYIGEGKLVAGNSVFEYISGYRRYVLFLIAYINIQLSKSQDGTIQIITRLLHKTHTIFNIRANSTRLHW